jgi:leader peptidase (prepilin peptidase)/N-methyltransferase
VFLRARRLELVDRCYKEVEVRLSQTTLRIGDEVLDPEPVRHMEAVCSEVVLPREAMGLGDVKFMAAIGAFLGWQAVLFSLVASSLFGALVGLVLVVTGRRALSSRLPYGPYIALAAATWIFVGPAAVEWYKHLLMR